MQIEVANSRALTAAEHQAFERCCATVETGLKTFIDVGEALATLKEGRLYRIAFPGYSFEQFVAEKWGKTRQWAYQQISARNLALSMGDTVTVPSERIARALMPLNDNPGAQRLTLTLAIATAPDGKLTTEWVESSVAVMQDVLGTEGLVDPGANSEWTAVNAAITAESHKRMLEKRAQIMAGKQQAIAKFIVSGEVLQAIIPEQIEVSMEKQYRCIVYEVVQVDEK